MRPNHFGRGQGSIRQLTIKGELGSGKQASQSLLVRSVQCPKHGRLKSCQTKKAKSSRSWYDGAKPPRVFAHDVPDAEKMVAFLCWIPNLAVYRKRNPREQTFSHFETTFAQLIFFMGGVIPLAVSQKCRMCKGGATSEL